MTMYDSDRLRAFVIRAGRAGENEARKIEIDVSGMQAEWPGATITLFIKRPGDGLLYPASSTISGGVLRWTVKAADVAYAGTGEIEVRATAGDVIAKSVTGVYRVEPSLTGSEAAEVPEVVADWIAGMEAATDAANAAASAANDAASAANDAAEAAIKAANEAADGSGVTIDATLTQSGQAADAKAVGDALADKANTSALSKVATSGSYNDLSNKPTIPAAYSLPTASATVLGGVKVGSGLTITNGVLSLDVSNANGVSF